MVVQVLYKVTQVKLISLRTGISDCKGGQRVPYYRIWYAMVRNTELNLTHFFIDNHSNWATNILFGINLRIALEQVRFHRIPNPTSLVQRVGLISSFAETSIYRQTMREFD